MKNELLGKKIASLSFGGRLIELIPDRMRQNGKTYSLELDGVLFEYTVDFPDDASFSTSMRIANVGGTDSPQMTGILSFDCVFPKTGSLVLETLSGDNCSDRSFLSKTRNIPDGFQYSASPTGGRSSNTTAFPYFDVTDEDGTAVFGIGWSGQWKLEISPEPDRYAVRIGLCRCDFYLKPGESVLLPSVVCRKDRGAIRARNAFRDLLRRRFSPQAGEAGDLFRPICFSMGSCFDDAKNREDVLLSQVEAAGRLGFEVAWADAIWFEGKWDRGVGNYRFKDFLPRGLRPVSDRAHSLDMQYLQWFEIERAFPRTEMYADHRELLLWCMTRSEFDLVDLGRPETRRLLFEKLSAMIREQNIDILRIDANIDPLLYWETNDEADRLGVKEMKYIEGLYALWDSLLAAFPRLKIDNCASGGRRLDFELTKRSVSYCRSDYTNNGIRGDMVRAACLQTMHLNRYLPFTSPIVFSDPVPYLCRASFTGAVCFDEKYLAQDARETAAALIAECKRVRPLWNGDFYALTGDDALWSAYQVARGESGAAYFFRHPGSGEVRLTVGLQAIEEDALYRVDVTDEALHTVRGTKTGKELLLGVEILLKEPEESALLEYEKL